MSKTKTTKKVLTGITDMQANEALGTFAAAESRIAFLNASIEAAITKIRQKYEEELAELAERKESQFEIIEAYAQANPDLFADKKSIELQHGTIGYRTNPPSVKQHKGVKVETSIDLMLKNRTLKEYVVEKTTYSIDKKALLEQRDNPKVAQLLDSVYVSIVQDETFYVEPKKEAAAKS